ncbi:MAG: hypothetical protein KME57_02780 [Scytonema hyalinum WJT4-NPBG1]|nr:hypothetical protein [Scytonema hyalinum WJT4-NPBG1]
MTLKSSFCGQPEGFGAVGLLYRQIVIVLLPDFKYLTTPLPSTEEPALQEGFPPQVTGVEPPHGGGSPHTTTTIVVILEQFFTTASTICNFPDQ